MSERRSFHEHLRGWQLGVVAVGTALGAVSLSLPRAVAPRELPLPAVDRVLENEAFARDRAMIRDAEVKPLSFNVRAAGEVFRRFGKAEVEGDVAEAEALSHDFANQVTAGRKESGDGALLALRAVQANLFVRAVDDGNATELSELGGSFFTRAAALRDAYVQDDELRSLFEMRWTKLSGTMGVMPFMPTLNEWRLYYRTLMAHPELLRAGSPANLAATAPAIEKCVEALSKHDIEYPRTLTLGILELWQGHFDTAEPLLVAHLAAHRSGEWHLRAQNYLLAARRHVTPADF